VITARRAAARMMSVSQHDPDRLTSLADCRIALCIAADASLADIDPAQGWDLSDRAYRTVRDRWADIAREGSTAERAPWAKARATWARLRPDLIDDWPQWDADE
jgi:hypothetical protein